MNKSEFIDMVADKAELTRAAAARVVDAIFDTASGAISEAVHAAGSLSIPGFGKVTRRTRAARAGRNPRTGSEIKIPERTTVGFSAGRGLKEQRSTSRRKPATTKAASTRASGAKSTTARSTAAKPAASKSSAAKSTSRASAAKPAASRAAAKPAAKPAASKSTAAKSTASKSTASKSGGAKSGGKGK
jgi:DNA-binding protein HU-beta